jgi:hypothetical protein
MRIALSLATFVLLAACGEFGAKEMAASDDGTRVACAVDGAASFEQTCVLEREEGADGAGLTLRHPDGGFRRLSIAGDGREVVAADGSEPARVTVVNDHEIEVAIAADRYRLPVTVAGLAAQ